MHILKIIHGYPPAYNAGSEVYSQTLCEALSKRHQVSVFTREENPYRADFSIREEKIGDRFTIFWVNLPREKDGFAHPQLDRKFRSLVERIHPDLAHIGHLNHLSTGLPEVLFHLQIPIVFTLHDFWLMCPRGQFLQVNFGQSEFHQLCEGQSDRKCAMQCYNRYFSSSEPQEESIAYWTSWIGERMAATQALSEGVSLFVAPSNYLRERFIRDFGIAPDRIHYLDYGFDSLRFHKLEEPPQRPFTFGYIGTHIPAKGIHLLLEAFAQLKGDAVLRIFGRPLDKSTYALKKMADACQLPVYFEGEYDNHQISEKVFSAVDAIVVPSIWTENSPLVIHESQACRVPVITADVGGMAEYVQHQVNGLLFSHRNGQSLAQQMQYALNHPQRMRELGQRGYLLDDQGEIPSIDAHVSALENIYVQLLSTSQSTKNHVN